MIVHLLRHGMTMANEKRLYYGSTDLPLSEKGVEELKRLKSTLTLPVADYHVTSELQRAKESLRILFDKTPEKTVEKLNEYNFGAFEMKSHEELKDPLAGVFQWRCQRPACCRFAGKCRAGASGRPG